MRTALLFLIGLLSLNVALAQELATQYKIEARNMIYEGIEKSFIIITIINDSDTDLQHKGYGFTAEDFSAADTQGNTLKDSAWVSGLRRKKRSEQPIVVPAKGNTYLMYSLDQLFTLETKNEITVVCGLSKNVQIKITKPK